MRFPLADDFGGITDCDSVARNISRNNGAGPNKRVLADGYSRVYGASSPDGGELLDPCLEQRPVTGGPRILVVGKGDIWPDENAILNRYSGRDENEGSDLTFIPNRDAFFDVDVSVYFRVLADSAPVEVYVVVDSRAFSNLRLLDNRIFRAFPHVAGIPSVEGIWTCIVRS